MSTPKGRLVEGRLTIGQWAVVLLALRDERRELRRRALEATKEMAGYWEREAKELDDIDAKLAKQLGVRGHPQKEVAK